MRDRTDIFVRDFLCEERTLAFSTAVVRRMHIFSDRHGCNRVRGGGDWPHPILGVLQPDEKIGILRFENCTFKYTCLDYSEGGTYLFVYKILYTYIQYLLTATFWQTRIYFESVFSGKEIELFSRCLHCVRHFESTRTYSFFSTFCSCV